MDGAHPWSKREPEPFDQDAERPDCPTCGAAFEVEERHCSSATCTWWLCSIDHMLFDERTGRAIRVRRSKR